MFQKKLPSLLSRYRSCSSITFVKAASLFKTSVFQATRYHIPAHHRLHTTSTFMEHEEVVKPFLALRRQ